MISLVTTINGMMLEDTSSSPVTLWLRNASLWAIGTTMCAGVVADTPLYTGRMVIHMGDPLQPACYRRTQ